MFLSILILTAHYLQKSLNLKSVRPQAYHSVGKSRDCETARLPFIVSKTKLLQYNCRLEWCFDIVADILAVWQCNRMQVSIFIFVQLNNLKNCLIAIWSPFLVHGQQVSNQQFLSQTSLESFCVSSSSFRILYLCHLPSILLLLAIDHSFWWK